LNNGIEFSTILYHFDTALFHADKPIQMLQALTVIRHVILLMQVEIVFAEKLNLNKPTKLHAETSGRRK